MKLTVRVWRQRSAREPGWFEQYDVDGLRPDMSFLELFDALNERLTQEGREPVAFDHDCREGICGACSMMINGYAHGPQPAVATCQLYLRHFQDGQTVTVEPWRARAFPVIKDLVVDRSAFDRILQAGGYVSVDTGDAPEANTTPVPKPQAETAMDAAACIGCGACVAACPNASAMLFVAAKVSHLATLPQGKPEAKRRVLQMVQQMDREGFGNCTNHYECMAACPKAIHVKFIAQMNRQYFKAQAAKPRWPISKRALLAVGQQTGPTLAVGGLTFLAMVAPWFRMPFFLTTTALLGLGFIGVLGWSYLNQPHRVQVIRLLGVAGPLFATPWIFLLGALALSTPVFYLCVGIVGVLAVMAGGLWRLQRWALWLSVVTAALSLCPVSLFYIWELATSHHSMPDSPLQTVALLRAGLLCVAPIIWLMHFLRPSVSKLFR